ncbi:MAG: ShlB/FhaC/HecB family hemolysin secretion/activation protein [Sedimenticola sp.]
MFKKNVTENWDYALTIKAIIITLFALLTSMSVSAQQLPSAGQELERERQREEQRKLPSFPSEIIEPAKPTRPISDAGVKIPVISFVFTGEMSVFPESVLQAQVADAIGKELSLKELKSIVARIETLYTEHGYFLSQAIIPPQDATEGTIRLEIIEGYRDESPAGLQIEGENLRIHPEKIRAIIKSALPSNQPVQQLALERGVLLIKNLSGVDAEINLDQGGKPGTTRLILDVKESPMIAASAGVDNTGSRLLGSTRVNLSMNVSNPMGWGEQLTANAAKSLGTGSLDYLSLGYSHPLGSRGLRLGLNYNHLNYNVGKEFTSLNASGSSNAWGVDARYPVILNRLNNLSLLGGMDYKLSEEKTGSIKTGASKIISKRIGLGASHVDEFWNGGITEGMITYHWGDLDLSEVASSLAADQAATGPHTHGQYSKIEWNLRRTQRTTDNFFIVADIRGQTALDNLGSSEKIQLGGPSGVRAYPGGEASGDSGYITTLEGQYTVKSAAKYGDARLIFFYDWGHIQKYHTASNLVMTTPNSYNLHGYGIGIKVTQQNSYDISLTWARRTGKNPARDAVTGNDADGSRDLDRFWITALYNF